MKHGRNFIQISAGYDSNNFHFNSTCTYRETHNVAVAFGSIH